MKTNDLINQFKTWDGASWFRHHLAWMKGSYSIVQGVKAVKTKKKAPKVHTLPFFPNVSHASSEIRDVSGQEDRDWRDMNINRRLVEKYS